MSHRGRRFSAIQRRDLFLWLAIAVAATFAALWFLPPIDALFASLLAILALSIAKADLDRFEIPDYANLALFALGAGWIVLSAFDIGESLLQVLLRTLVAGGFCTAVKLLYRLVRKVEGLGWGDVKLAAAGAVWLTWQQMPIALLLAAMAGVLAATVQSLRGDQAPFLQTALPLGAFLAPAIWLVWFAELAGLP